MYTYRLAIVQCDACYMEVDVWLFDEFSLAPAAIFLQEGQEDRLTSAQETGWLVAGTA